MMRRIIWTLAFAAAVLFGNNVFAKEAKKDTKAKVPVKAEEAAKSQEPADMAKEDAEELKDADDAEKKGQVGMKVDKDSMEHTGTDMTKTPGAAQGGGIFGPFRVGPTVAAGFPHLLTYSLDMTYAKVVNAAITFGDNDIEGGGVKIGISNFDVRARWFPFMGSFFLGANYGQQTLSAAVANTITANNQAVKTDLEMAIKTNYLTPNLGWFKTFGPGFTLGFEVGYQLALSAKTDDVKVKTDSGDPVADAAVQQTTEYAKLNKDIKEQGKNIGDTNLLYVNLIRLGWLL